MKRPLKLVFQRQYSLLEVLLWLLAVSLLLTMLATWWAGGLYEWLGGNLSGEAAGPDWGGLSEWFESVIGVCVGFAGAAIAIWLAFKVHEISKQQLLVSSQQMLNDVAANIIQITKDDQLFGRRIQASKDLCGVVNNLFTSAIEISKQGDMFEDLRRSLEGQRCNLDEDLNNGYINQDDFDAAIEDMAREIEDMARDNNEKVSVELAKQIECAQELLRILIKTRRSYRDADVLKLFNNRLGHLPSKLDQHLSGYLDPREFEMQEHRDPKGFALAKRICNLVERQKSGRGGGEAVDAYLLSIAFLVERLQADSSAVWQVARDSGDPEHPQTGGLKSFWEEYALRSLQSPEEVFELGNLIKFLPPSEFWEARHILVSMRIIPNLTSLAFDLVNPFTLKRQLLDNFKNKSIKAEVVSEDVKAALFEQVEMVLNSRLQEIDVPDDPFFEVALAIHENRESIPPGFCITDYK